jgi:hypothetical protein
MKPGEGIALIVWASPWLILFPLATGALAPELKRAHAVPRERMPE